MEFLPKDIIELLIIIDFLDFKQFSFGFFEIWI